MIRLTLGSRLGFDCDAFVLSDSLLRLDVRFFGLRTVWHYGITP